MIFKMSETYQEYLSDESRYQGKAESISFPENEDQILEILEKMRDSNNKITIQGGKTGIVGGAVPDGGHILNLSRMNQCKGHEVGEDGTVLLRVEPGINLIELDKEIGKISSKQKLFWPPGPTETSATVGGIAASNAKGITQFLYGDTKQYISGVRMIAGDGSIHEISGKAELREVLGREGITGIFSELTLKLLAKPLHAWGVTFFFIKNQDAEAFLNELLLNLPQTETAQIAAIEYLDRSTINLIEARKEFMTKIKELPDIESQFTDMVYFELQGEEDGIEEIAEQLMELGANHGSDPDWAWAVSGEMEIEKMHAFRHAAAETANLFVDEVRRGDERITKLAIDMTVPNAAFQDVVSRYREAVDAAGLKCCIFGHVAGTHLHINILPRNYDEYQDGLKLLDIWAERVQKLQGTVVSEHGIGKLKRELYRKWGSVQYLNECRNIKQKWDQNGIFNRGNILEWKEGMV